MPVIVEDDVLIGGNTGVYEGAIIKTRAVIAAGTVLTGSTPVYDLVKGRSSSRLPIVHWSCPKAPWCPARER
jgi:2,3,4,5-tetrahydropyridine-2-carboxylate N-succinyltransferase